ncbi:2TM domain-containing protein [candidate division WOR-3 bacterium]|nr:2TM domain-containing protein [candidate division WOR-3 bacterium]
MLEDRDKDLYRRARDRVTAQRSFFIHLIIYLLVNAMLFILNAATRDPDDGWWFYWPLIGWGIGILSHAFSVFGAFGLFNRDWEEKQVEKMVRKERERQDKP